MAKASGRVHERSNSCSWSETGKIEFLHLMLGALIPGQVYTLCFLTDHETFKAVSGFFLGYKRTFSSVYFLQDEKTFFLPSSTSDL